MNKNPILVITGLAVAAVAGVAGLTKDKWMGGTPSQMASVATAPAAEAPAQPSAKVEPTVEPAPAATEQTTAAVPAEQPAPAVTAAETPAKVAETAASDATAPAEQPAASAVTANEATQAPKIEEPAVAATAEQPAAAAPAAEQPAPAKTTEVASNAPAAAEPQAEATTVKPSFDTVRVEKSGEAVIAGTAEAGSEVVIKLDGQAIGTTTANGDGAFVVVPDAPLPAGSGALTIEATGKGDQLAVQSEQSVAVIIPAEAKQDALVAIVSPDAPTKVLQKPAPQPETQVAAAQPDVQPEPEAAVPATTAASQPAANKPVSIDAVDYDSTGNIVFSGQGQAGNMARVYVDNSHAGDAVIAADSRWSFSATANIAAGQHSLRVDGIDGAGKVANRVEVPFFREDTSKVAAATQDAAKTDSQAVTEGQSAATTTTVNAGTTDAAAVPPKQGRVVIQPGNNLWRISRVLYGSGEKYTMLYQANKDQIRDPDMIFPGQIFTTPDVAPKVETIDPHRREPLKPEENAASAP